MTDTVKSILDAVRGADNKRTLIAIDGRCGSGKTTFAENLASRLDAPVIHMDDFYLPKELRTPERMAEVAGNIDRERFLQEILMPLQTEGTCCYRPYDCGIGDFGEEIRIPKREVVIVEGSYSCHPEFWDFYGLRLFLTVDPSEQLRRILIREGEEKVEMFRTRWIPREEAYFGKLSIADRCDFVINTTTI